MGFGLVGFGMVWFGMGFGLVEFGLVGFGWVGFRLGMVGLVCIFIKLPKQRLRHIQACPELGPVSVPACSNWFLISDKLLIL